MRRRYLLDTRFQALFTLKFTVGALFLTAFLSVLFVGMLYILGSAGPVDAMQRALILERAKNLLIALILLNLIFILLSAAFGFYWSFKLVGPISRLEYWLETILADEKPEPLILRPGDELRRTADLLADLAAQHKGHHK